MCAYEGNFDHFLVIVDRIIIGSTLISTVPSTFYPGFELRPGVSSVIDVGNFASSALNTLDL